MGGEEEVAEGAEEGRKGVLAFSSFSTDAAQTFPQCAASPFDPLPHSVRFVQPVNLCHDHAGTSLGLGLVSLASFSQHS